MSDAAPTLLCMKLLLRHVPISRPTIYRLVARDEFPKPVKLGKGSFWVEQEVKDWMRGRMTARDGH